LCHIKTTRDNIGDKERNNSAHLSISIIVFSLLALGSGAFPQANVLHVLAGYKLLRMPAKI
jgi:hypothetical protein